MAMLQSLIIKKDYENGALRALHDSRSDMKGVKIQGEVVDVCSSY